MATSIEKWTHDCSKHHHQFPTDGSPPEVRAYDSLELKDRLLDIWALGAHDRCGTPKLRQLRYELISTYRYADFKTATLAEIEGSLEHWATLIDQYFLAGALTQGPEKRVSLHLSFVREKGAVGATFFPTLGYPQIHINLTRRYYPGRRSKGDLLTTLFHEMCHAFCGLYYNRCSAIPGEVHKEYLAEIGHGDLWYSYNYVIVRALRSWLPEIANDREHPERFPYDLWLDYQFWTRYLAINTTLPWPLSRGGLMELESRRAGLQRPGQGDLNEKLGKVLTCVSDPRSAMTICSELAVFILVLLLYGFRRLVLYLSFMKLMRVIGLVISCWILSKFY
ncbi:hypothetical protein HD806DRAFT_552868 [Xylariaceae sp. AK1471]|nr:hypothetical protein HD806DRAFT_552868 [Xylariaceae sp. AK1471]